MYRVILVFIVFIFACQSQPQESKSERMAKAVCNCANQLLVMNKQAAESAQQVDLEAIQAEYDRARACIAEQRMKPEDLPEMEKMLATKCPDLAAEGELLGELLGK